MDCVHLPSPDPMWWEYTRYVVVVVVVCPICGEKEEILQHLFFDCTFSNKCPRQLLEWMDIGIQNVEFQGLWRRMTRGSMGRNKREFILTVLTALT